MLRKIFVSTISLSLITGAAAFAQSEGEKEAPAATERAQRGPAARFFNRLDTNGDGVITVDEFGSGRLDALRSADIDGDGVLSQDELFAYVQERAFRRQAERMARFLDIDGDGIATLEEIETYQAKRFALLDRNNDGEVSPDELRRGGWRMARSHNHHHGGRYWHGSRQGKFMHRMNSAAQPTAIEEEPADN